MVFPCAADMDKKPTYGRCFWRLIIACLMATPVASLAQGPGYPPARVLTEAEAVQLGLTRPEVEALLEGEIDWARSDVLAARRLPNPAFSYSREDSRGATMDSQEDFFWLTQRVDLSGRRGLHTRAAEHRVHATAYETERRRFDLEAEIRRRFFEVLYREMRVQVVKRWSERMQAVAGIVRRQEAEGEVSAYDGRRLSREQAGAAARLQAEEASLANASERLKAFIGGEGRASLDYRVSGSLLSGSSPSLDAFLAALAARPDLQGLEQQAAAAELDQKAAGRWWIPEITVGAGVKQVSEGSHQEAGPMVSATIPLPVFDRNEPETSHAKAEVQVARNKRSLAWMEAVGDVRGLWQQAQALTEAARRLREQAVSHASELIQTAEVAYQGGEMGILELLDAYRSTLDAEVQALELEFSARQAGIELDRLTGRSVVRSPADRNDQGPMQKARTATP
jgi:outer membrane protein, heavy metal efflux system